MSELNDNIEDTEISAYEDKHRPHNQNRIVHGFCINPVLRHDFDVTSNDERDPLEVKDWWGRPFILENEYWQPDNSYEEYAERCSDFTTTQLESKQEWEDKQKTNKQDFIKNYPTGKAYTVRCLSGGAWDRSSWCGDFASIDEAASYAASIDGHTYSGKSYKANGAVVITEEKVKYE